MSDECDKCDEHCSDCKSEITIKISEQELKKILTCMDITKDEFGPFPSRDIFYKLYKKLKSYLK